MSFKDRMFKASEEVYDRIVRGEVTDVEAELLDAQLKASGTETEETED